MLDPNVVEDAAYPLRAVDHLSREETAAELVRMFPGLTPGQAEQAADNALWRKAAI